MKPHYFFTLTSGALIHCTIIHVLARVWEFRHFRNRAVAWTDTSVHCYCGICHPARLASAAQSHFLHSCCVHIRPWCAVLTGCPVDHFRTVGTILWHAVHPLRHHRRHAHLSVGGESRFVGGEGGGAFCASKSRIAQQMYLRSQVSSEFTIAVGLSREDNVTDSCGICCVTPTVVRNLTLRLCFPFISPARVTKLSPELYNCCHRTKNRTKN